jgi:hypothetical protein
MIGYICQISDSSGGENKDYGLLDCDTTDFVGSAPTFAGELIFFFEAELLRVS